MPHRDDVATPESRPPARGNRLSSLARGVLPPLLVVGAWQALWAAAFWSGYRLPAPAAVLALITDRIGSGEIAGFLWARCAGRCSAS